MSLLRKPSTMRPLLFSLQVSLLTIGKTVQSDSIVNSKHSKYSAKCRRRGTSLFKSDKLIGRSAVVWRLRVGSPSEGSEVQNQAREELGSRFLLHAHSI